MKLRYEVRVRRIEWTGADDPKPPPTVTDAAGFLSWLDAMDNQIVEGPLVTLARRSSLAMALRTFDRFIWVGKRFAEPDPELRFEVYDRKRREVIETGRRYA